MKHAWNTNSGSAAWGSSVKVPVDIHCRDISLPSALRIDPLVDGLVIVELKAVEKLVPIHEAQVPTSLRLSGLHVALLINFNVPAPKEGIKRVVLD